MMPWPSSFQDLWKGSCGHILQVCFSLKKVYRATVIQLMWIPVIGQETPASHKCRRTCDRISFLRAILKDVNTLVIQWCSLANHINYYFRNKAISFSRLFSSLGYLRKNFPASLLWRAKSRPPATKPWYITGSQLNRENIPQQGTHIT